VEASNRRADFRVEVPPVFLNELAIWFCQEKDYVRLSASELGRPHLTLTRLGSGRMTVSDLSIRGMGMHVALPPEATAKLASAKACFIYLQLADPTADDPYGILSVFTYSALVRVAPRDGGIFLGARFVRFAVGSRLEKTLEFLDAQACGVTALARWCDNVARGAMAEPGRHRAGLDMDHLLEEVEAALASAGTHSGEHK